MPTLSGLVGPPALIEILRELVDEWKGSGRSVDQCAAELKALLDGYEGGGG